MCQTVIGIENVTKEYKLGAINARTFYDELQSRSARRRGVEDPNTKIGAAVCPNGIIKALDDISLTVKKGEIIGLIGGNGAGKSTLLKLISRITVPTSGTIGFNGRVAGLLEIGTGFHRELTGRENIYLNGAILGMKKKEIDARLDEIIDFSEISQFIDTPVKRYSSGMFVKLAFSVAAHLQSEILLMDEVLAVGDVKFRRKCLEKMSEASAGEGKTIIYVSHLMSTVRQLCTRSVVLEKGKIIFDGDVEAGIEKYHSTGSSADMNAKRSLSELVRVSGFVLRAQMQSLEAVGKRDMLFSASEKIMLRLRWKALCDLDGVFFRTVFRLSDGSPAGMATTIEPTSARENQIIESTLEIDISPLVAGSYSADLSVYSKSGNGSVDNLDFIREAYVFEYSGSDSANGLRWFSGSWGSVSFPPIVPSSESICNDIDRNV